MTLYLGNNLISGVATPTEPTRNLGQIIESIVPLTDAGLHLLDGSLINGSGIYSAFVDAIADLVTEYPDLFETEANWQSAVSTYGVCGKFVYDSVNNTVRLPKITGIIEGTTDLSALGDLVEAGLPNITGTTIVQATSSNGNTNTPNGAFASDGSYATLNGKDVKTITVYGGNFDASRSSSIYGNSNTVQPQTIKAFYYIVIATSTKTEIQVDIDEIATDLNGKVDKSDLAEVQCVVETYQNGTSGYWIRSDGYCEQWSSNVDTGTAAHSITTINFLKPFKNINYTISLSFGKDDTNPDTNATYSRTNKTTTSFQIRRYGTTTRYADWQACGYIEV